MGASPAKSSKQLFAAFVSNEVHGGTEGISGYYIRPS